MPHWHRFCIEIGWKTVPFLQFGTKIVPPRALFYGRWGTILVPFFSEWRHIITLHHFHNSIFFHREADVPNTTMDFLYAVLLLVIAYMIYCFIDHIIRLPQLTDLSSRYILVTGCDTGFGNAISKRLDQRGCHVISGCLTEAGETDLRKSCSSRLKTIHMDVTSPESVQKAYDTVKELLPPGRGG